MWLGIPSRQLQFSINPSDNASIIVSRLTKDNVMSIVTAFQSWIGWSRSESCSRAFALLLTLRGTLIKINKGDLHE
jgi:hypothetical protein